jgi:hypothetical protein
MAWITLTLAAGQHYEQRPEHITGMFRRSDDTTLVYTTMGQDPFCVLEDVATIKRTIAEAAPAPAVEVTDAMVERAMNAYWTTGMRAALIAALTPEAR